MSPSAKWHAWPHWGIYLVAGIGALLSAAALLCEWRVVEIVP